MFAVRTWDRIRIDEIVWSTRLSIAYNNSHGVEYNFTSFLLLFFCSWSLHFYIVQSFLKSYKYIHAHIHSVCIIAFYCCMPFSGHSIALHSWKFEYKGTPIDTIFYWQFIVFAILCIMLKYSQLHQSALFQVAKYILKATRMNGTNFKNSSNLDFNT